MGNRVTVCHPVTHVMRTKEESKMADELNKDWQKELDEQEAELDKNEKLLRRWEIASYCLQMLAIAFLTTVVCFGAFELGRYLELRAEKQRQKTCAVEPAKVQAAGLPTIVPDDIYKGYAMVFGVEVPAIARDMGLTPSP